MLIDTRLPGGSGRPAREVPSVRATVGAAAIKGAASPAGEGWREPRSRAAAPRQPEPAPPGPKPIPKGWPAADAVRAFAALLRSSSPWPVLVAGAEGGCGATTVAALAAETLAAACVGGVLAVDQSRLPCSGGIGLRLLGEPVGLPVPALADVLQPGRAVPTSPAGAVVVTDVHAYTPLAHLVAASRSRPGFTVVDSGHVDLAVAAHLTEMPCHLVLVGRADVAGAQGICAALQFLRRSRPFAPLVVLVSTAPSNRRRVHAAHTLVRTAGVKAVVHLPFDPALAAGAALRLDHVGRTTARACLQLAVRVGTPGEAGHFVHLPPARGPGGPFSGAAATAWRRP